MLFVVITFNILILNFIIAIFSSTFTKFEPNSKGLYLSKIIWYRKEMEYDPYYGALITTNAPFNVHLILFIPFYIFLKDTRKLNSLLVFLHYLPIALLATLVFIAGSLGMLPTAYIKVVIMKINKLFSEGLNKRQLIFISIEIAVFILFGGLILFLDIIADTFYFVKLLARTNLKKTVLERKLQRIRYGNF